MNKRGEEQKQREKHIGWRNIIDLQRRKIRRKVGMLDDTKEGKINMKEDEQNRRNEDSSVGTYCKTDLQRAFQFDLDFSF